MVQAQTSFIWLDRFWALATVHQKAIWNFFGVLVIICSLFSTFRWLAWMPFFCGGWNCPIYRGRPFIMLETCFGCGGDVRRCPFSPSVPRPTGFISGGWNRPIYWGSSFFLPTWDLLWFAEVETVRYIRIVLSGLYQPWQKDDIIPIRLLQFK